jgi:hypothetical protein
MAREWTIGFAGRVVRAWPRSITNACRDCALAVVVFTLAIVCLSGVALLNGFPLMFPDTIKYLGTARTLAPTWDRPPFYGWIIFLLVGRNSLWPIILLQSAASVALLWLTFRTLAGRRYWAFLFIVAALAVFSSLPWFTDQIMCDFATAFVPLGIFLLAFCNERLTAFERLFVIAIFFVTILIHTSHLLLAAVIVVVFGLARGIGATSLSRRGLALLGGTVVAGLLTVLVTNGIAFGRLTVAPGAAGFTVDRMLSDGVGGAYLGRHCGEKRYVLCRYIDRMPTQSGWLLFNYDSPLWTVWATGDGRHEAGRAAFETAAVEAARPELEEIATGAWREFPILGIVRTVEGSAMQLFLTQIGEGLDVHGRFPGLEWELADRSPAQLIAFHESRQDRNILPITFFRWLDLAVLVIGMSVTYVALRSPGWRPGDLWQRLVVTILSACVVNALICGGLDMPAPRFQARLVWLIDFTALVFLLRYRLSNRSAANHATMSQAAVPDRAGPS